MSRRRIWLRTFLAIVFTVAALSPIRCDLLGASREKINWSEFVSKDPAFLYLGFTQVSFNPAALMTWLHPTEKRTGLYVETKTSDYEPQAFTFRLVREAPDGYEVSFQRIDPKTERPLQTPAKLIFFPRSKGKPTQLTDRTYVAGFYGNPQQRPSW